MIFLSFLWAFFTIVLLMLVRATFKWKDEPIPKNAYLVVVFWPFIFIVSVVTVLLLLPISLLKIMLKKDGDLSED